MDQVKVPEEVRNYLTEAYSAASQWTLPGDRGNYETSQPIHLETVAVIGGGTMGRGIAISLCRAGYKTFLVENDQKALEWCRKELEITYKREKDLKRYSDELITKLRDGIVLTTELEQLKDCDMIIEAIFENMAIKKELWGKLEKICKKECIFGTNTSSLDLNEMSKNLSDRSRLVGIHFFNPAHVIKVVEVVFGDFTSGAAVASAFSVCEAMKKIAVLVGNCVAFVFNRLLAVYLNQTTKLLYQYGMLPHHVDQIVVSYGFLMGPLTMTDMNGLDVMEKFKKENNLPLNVLETTMCELKRYGRKTAKGYYCYDVNQKKHNDMEMERIIRRVSKDQKINIQLLCDQDVINFLLLPMVNEGFLCIEEGIIEKECLIDIMFIFGFGWPPVQGGPMKNGRTYGIEKIAEIVGSWHALEPEDRSYMLSRTLKEARNGKARI